MRTKNHKLKGKCKKQTTLAIVVNGDKYFIGSNSCNEPQDTCPRDGMKTGVGYELCKDVCGQKNHAEVDVIKKSGKYAKGGILFLVGHYYLCDNCKNKVREAGIKKIIVVDDLILRGRE